MHIVVLSNYSPPYEGGIQMIMRELAEQYVTKGHRVTIIACDTGIPRGITQEYDGAITKIGIAAWNGLEDRSIPYPIFNPIALFDTLNRVLKDADAIHLHGFIYMNTVLAALLGKQRRIPVILTEHVSIVQQPTALGNIMQRGAFHTLGRLCTWFSDVVVTYNPRVEEEMRTLLRPDTPLLDIRNGVDTSRFRPPHDAAERATLRQKWGFTRKTALFVGRFVYKKGFDLTAQSIRPDDEFDLAMCGKGEYTSPQANINVIGKVNQDELSEIYRAADVLVLPSIGEGFPLTIQEALACGLPVIVTDNHEYRAYLDETMAVFTERDPAIIRENILRVLNLSDNAWQQMSHAARELAVREFDWSAAAETYLKLYANGKQTTPAAGS